MEHSDSSAWPLTVVDWGTSNLRAYLIDSTGRVLRSVERREGVKSLRKAQFSEHFHAIRQDLGSDRPALLLGMVGSNLGWMEVPVRQCPADASDLVRHLVPVPGTNAMIVPGVAAPSLSGAFEMMRGEETQALGAVARFDQHNAHICLPGTHTKWLMIGEDRFQQITTSMTGEAFAWLVKDSVLSGHVLGADEQTDLMAFDEGVRRSQTGLGALQIAFTTRPRALLEEKSNPANAISYLSGVLIGAEVEALQRVGQLSATIIVGEQSLASLYGRACTQYGINTEIMDGAEAVALGAARIWQAYLDQKDPE